ncbi:phosphodiester glycosidase family protein [Streptomyces sp. ISL-36]|uniref:phosphodiester glycosidase family protein n=1 Tax=Streptomyces sp. ISL-36 TaxID=2819182 RepID=UPI001BEAF109|nr:phosphodiester glycosidase family protein [Streptomyces sp. ISL-36]MBT2444392.1 phosphodiester glycosidase family protein [Streptomyces sp. ISL-36]
MTTPLRPALAAAALTAALVLTTSTVTASSAADAVVSPLAANWVQTPVAGADKLPAGITVTNWTEKNLENRTRPRLLQVVEIDPTAAPLDLSSTVGAGDGLAETVADQLAGVSSVASRHPVAGVNGSLFKSEPSHPDLREALPLTLQHMGVSVTDGVLHSSSCYGGGQGTSGAVIQYGVPYITKLRTQLSLQAADGSPAMAFDDINRDPGRARGCGRDKDDRLVDESITHQRGVYTDADEIVLFTSDYKYPVPKPDLDATITTDDDPGYEVVLDSTGKVTAAHAGRGGGKGSTVQVRVPSGGRILQGVGTGATWLSTHALVGTHLEVSQKLIDTRFGREIPLDPSVDVVSSFHQLLRDGAIVPELVDTCGQQGPGATPGTTICTDSRVALGTNVRGHTVLVTLTGQPQADNTTTHEDGAWLHAFGELLDSEELGLIDALNLDGGGSATLITATADSTTGTINGTTVRTPPTDRVNGVYVHRAVSDAVYAGISGYGMYKK